MGIHRLKTVLLVSVLLAFAMQHNPVDAFNLGTLQKSYISNASAGETLALSILFWNAEEMEYTVQLSNIQVPEGWTVIANPRQFQLNSMPTGKTELVYLPGIKKAVAAKVVDIYISIPEKEQLGMYRVVLKASAGAGGESDSSFSVEQERAFLFDLNVVKGAKQRDIAKEYKAALTDANNLNGNEAINSTVESAEDTSDRKAQAREKGSRLAIILPAAIAILLVAWGIYRYD